MDASHFSSGVNAATKAYAVNARNQQLRGFSAGGVGVNGSGLNEGEYWDAAPGRVLAGYKEGVMPGGRNGSGSTSFAYYVDLPKAGAAAPAPAAQSPSSGEQGPAPTLNTAAIAEAKHRADAFKIGASPSLSTSGNPYGDAAQMGKAANDHFSDVTNYFNGQAGLAATEASEAGKYYTNRFIGKVPAVMSPEQIRDQFSWYKGQIA